MMNVGLCLESMDIGPRLLTDDGCRTEAVGIFSSLCATPGANAWSCGSCQIRKPAYRSRIPVRGFQTKPGLTFDTRLCQPVAAMRTIRAVWAAYSVIIQVPSKNKSGMQLLYPLHGRISSRSAGIRDANRSYLFLIKGNLSNKRRKPPLNRHACSRDKGKIPRYHQISGERLEFV